MSIYQLKPRFQSILRPFVVRLAASGVTANMVTLLACAVSVALGLGLACFSDYRALYFLVPIWLFLRMALNAIDGMLAREFGQASRLGACLNEVGDVVSDVALILPFAFLPNAPVLLVGGVAWLALLSEFAGVLAIAIGVNRRYDGPMGKSDRCVVIGVLALLVGFGHTALALNPWLWSVFGAVIALTVLQRLRRAMLQTAQS